MNSLLYGHNPKQHVVAVHQLNDRFIRLYTRTNGKIQHEDVEFFPFFFLSDATLLQDFPKQFWLKELTGGLFYNHIAAFSRWNDMWEAVNYALRSYNKYAPRKASHYNDVDSIFLRPDPVYQFLVQSGITLFKGMEFDDLLRMQIDVQRSPRSARQKGQAADEHIARIVLSDNTGWCDSIEFDDAHEKEELALLVSAVCERDPDVLEGHNLNGEIMPLLQFKAERHAIDLSIGRDGSSMKHVSPRQPFWSGEGESGFYEIAGRHCIDTQRLAEVYSGSNRSFENLTLDHLAQYFGIDANVSPPSAEEAPMSSKKKVEKPKQPPLENVQRVRRLSEYLSLSGFYLAQMCPFNFGTTLRTGTAAKIESLLVREYLRQKHSLPRPERGSQSRGGYTDIFFTGLFSHVLHADVESLYPSIIINQKIKPRSDILDIFIPLLTQLTAMRLDAKHAVQEAESRHVRNRLDALQSALKVMINSFYGYLAYARARFNDYEQADKITTLGQSYLRSVIDQARRLNAQVLEVDTDGLFFIPPGTAAGTESDQSLVQQLATSLPAGINLVLAGSYRKMFTYKKKNYALMDDSGKTIIRGSSLVSRNLELFARRYIEKCIECFLSEDIGTLHKTYTSLHRRILTHQWSAREFCRTETIKEDFETYERELKTGGHPASAPLEAAKRASLYPRPGVVLSYYVTGTDANVKIADNCRIVEEWDANLPDENTAYYLSRLAECSAKFRDFFSPADFEKIFSIDDLFGFTPSGIAILNRELQPQKPELTPEEHDDEFPIWLGDIRPQA